MKISKSKQELARIISENGGWRDGEFAAQNGEHGRISFSTNKPVRHDQKSWMAKGGFQFKIEVCKPLPNWHQTILSREEYFHLCPVSDADGWIEWKGGGCPVKTGELVDIRYRDGEEVFGSAANEDESDAGPAFWRCDDFQCDIIAYRLHKPEQSGAADKLSSEAVSAAKIALMSDSIEELVRKPEQAKPEFCESVTRAIPEPDEQVWTNPPSIEQLASDYRNAKDFAEHKQKEADDAKADADEKLRVLEIAGEALGLLVSPITSKQEPELVAAKFTGKFHSAKHGNQPTSLDMVCDGCGKRFGHHVGFECRP